MYYFLEEDFNLLNERIKKLQKKLKQVGIEKGESCRQSSETYHDNFPFEEAERQEYLLGSHLKEFLKIKDKAVIVRPNYKQNLKVALGKIVEIEDVETKKLKKTKIGSFLNLSNDKGDVISYNSPLGTLLMGSKINQIKKGKIGKNLKKFKIIKIE